MKMGGEEINGEYELRNLNINDTVGEREKNWKSIIGKTSQNNLGQRR